jgi:uncharacterized lipoprotein YmbA
MKLPLTRSISTALAVFAGLLFAGCQVLPEAVVDPTKYYVLNSPSPAPQAEKPAGKLLIGLQPVELPGYLRGTKSMVTRTGPNELRFDDFARWAEPLDAGLRRVLKEQIARADGVVRVVDGSSRDGKRDYDVSVRIDRCEGSAIGSRKTVLFTATYEIVDLRGEGSVVARKTFSAPEVGWDGSDNGALARLLSEAAAKLGDDIAAGLKP